MQIKKFWKYFVPFVLYMVLVEKSKILKCFDLQLTIVYLLAYPSAERQMSQVFAAQSLTNFDELVNTCTGRRPNLSKYQISPMHAFWR